MKKIFSTFLICLLCLLPFGCGKDKTPEHSTDFKYDVNDFVTLGDYMDVEVTIKEESEYEVTEDKATDYATQLIFYYNPVYVPDDSKTVVEETDIVDVDYVGKKDGVAFEGGSAENQILDVANNSDATRGTGFIDGFTSGLIGAKVGDTIDCNVTFPENYGAEDLAGQEVVFTFTVNAIEKAATWEEIDESVIQTIFQRDSKEAFLEEVKTNLESQLESSRQSDIRQAVVDEVLAKCEVTGIPEGLLDARVDEYLTVYETTYCTDGTTLEELLSEQGSTLEEFRQETAGWMEDNIKQELIFEAIVKKEDITLDESGYDDYVSNLNVAYENIDELYEAFGTGKESGEIYIKKMYLQYKACELIAEGAKVNYGEKENS